MGLETPLAEIKGLAQKFLVKLKRLGIQTAGDLVFHFPYRYEDFSRIKNAAELKIGENATVSGVVRRVKNSRSWRKRITITEAVIEDESGAVVAVWFNQPYVGKILAPGKRINLGGKLTAGKNGVYLSNPTYELITGPFHQTRHTAGLIPVYPETRGLTSKGLRYLIGPILEKLEKLPDFLPEETLQSAGLPEINLALRQIHSPQSPEEAALAKKRFAFGDIFLVQLTNFSERRKLAAQKAPAVPLEIDYLKSLIAALPFELTESQKKSLREVLGDLEKDQPMNRLLEGEVGSGKTVVVAIAALMTAKAGFQSVFMAPTEILARQHFKTFAKIFPDFEGIGLLTAAEVKIRWGKNLESKITKAAFKKAATSGEIKIIVGTHALIQKDVFFPKLALVVVDEQHRFGVKQRQALLRGTGAEQTPQSPALVPHFLSMSATPIPRTLALTIFGDLDLSIIDELPKGRRKILTKIVAPENREKAYQFVREQIKRKRQAFVVCPRIEPQTTNGEGQIVQDKRKKLWDEVKTVKEEYEKLSKKIFPGLKTAMLHGRMKPKEKEEVMKRFAERKADVLVSTSVVEVGVDVPNASVMMIESAERFGLAQLYQFRGRVGRGIHQSFCLLFTESSSRAAEKRLKAIAAAKNGFELAETDLAIRGPGEVLGGKQSGFPDLMMESLKDATLIKLAREEAEKILKTDPELKKHLHLKDRLEYFKKEIHLE